MFKKIFTLLLFIFIATIVVKAQPINISNIVTTGRFNTCGIAPTITATLLSNNGSIVQNGSLACLNPNDSSLVELNINNLRWNQSPNYNWLHSIYLTNGQGTGIRIMSNSLTPPNWIFMTSGCLGACPTGGNSQGGPGYYFDGNYNSSCCGFGNYTLDGIPCNNWGDSSAKCSKPYSISFLLKIKNFNIRNSLFLKLRGDSDGNTGCWSVVDSSVNTVTFSIAGIPCNINPVLCNPIGSATISTGLAGPYQQQNSTDSVVFNNIADNANYAGTNNAALSLINIASNRYGEQYRCVANGINGQVFTLTFKNTWTGAISTDWNTAGNWSCNAVPDQYTDVILNAGSNVVLSTSTTIRSILVRTGATLTVNSGAILTVLH